MVNNQLKQLTCSQCACVFEPNESQWKRRKCRTIVYCSDICRLAAVQLKLRKPNLTFGPCPTCKKMYESKRPKKFCSAKCYFSSDNYLKMLKENRLKGAKTQQAKAGLNLKGEHIACLECGIEIYVIPAMKGKKKFCSHLHYREFMAKRFDRWIASGEIIAELNNYDEFMTQESLPCFIEGCSWSGDALGQHLNYTHGIKATEAKRAAGFNLNTGLVSPRMHQKLSERDKIGVALIRTTPPKTSGFIYKYKSREGKEHASKARSLLSSMDGPKVICTHCKQQFQQSTVYGKTMFCSIGCREKLRQLKNRTGIYPCICSQCGLSFNAGLYKKKRTSLGQPVTCSIQCRNELNSSIRKKT